MRPIIVGSGPAGLTAAYILAKAGVKVSVMEADNSVGGMAKTIDLWGQSVDLGPHRFFSNDSRINKIWLENVGMDYKMVDRLTRIYYKNNFFYYPLKPFDALRKLGPFESTSCLVSYIKEKIFSTKLDGTFENWVVNRFGRKLFEIFFKTYTEKLWGISCRQLDSDFAAQRIKRLSLYEAIKNGFFRNGSTKHKTLLEQFAYPLDGSGIVYERMADFVVKHGGSLHLSSPVQRVIVKDNHVLGVELFSGEEVLSDTVVSTMPLTTLLNGLPNVPDDIRNSVATLKYRNTIIVFLEVDGIDLFPDNWLYVHAENLGTGRITNFRNWVPTLNNDKETTIIAMEYWCFESDKLWKETEDALIDIAKKEIILTGLLKNAPILNGYVTKISKSYPLYDRGYAARLKPIQDYLDSIHGLFPLGRAGTFKYNNQDHSIMMGLLVAENILGLSKNNLWEINTDYESYQESSTITESGLVIQ
jgi:protoporphyrinogen oxidase